MASIVGVTSTIAGLLYLVYAAPAILSIQARVVFCIVFFGYISYSSLLHVIFYRNAPAPKRSVHHVTLVSFNLLMAATCAMVSTELHMRGHSQMTFDASPSIATIVRQILVACVFENTVEYYWHCLLHCRFLYTRVHKVHHHYKRPQPFDDMYMHPFEGAVYFLVLYGPPFVFSMHVYAFAIYMIIMGTFGVLDHSGLPFRIPLVYNSEDHAMHHAKVIVNLGFPFPYLDILHGTFEGDFAGIKFHRPTRKL
ncbi:hypothetical protein AC1031_021708 [Aphanomyces cochlioides]|nr:hypothetical protein AC1031_021708 [Aphanomyces cochlioides]